MVVALLCVRACIEPDHQLQHYLLLSIGGHWFTRLAVHACLMMGLSAIHVVA